jgi:hypothetical protein
LKRGLKFILPFFGLLVSGTLLFVGQNRLVPKGADDATVAPETKLAYAVSAPAVVLRYPLLRLWEAAKIAGWENQTANNATFLLCVPLVWFWLGRSIAMPRDTQTKKQNRASRFFVNFTLVLLGALLAFRAWLVGSWRYETLFESFLYLSWGLFFLLTYGLELWRASKTSA